MTEAHILRDELRECIDNYVLQSRQKRISKASTADLPTASLGSGILDVSSLGQVLEFDRQHDNQRLLSSTGLVARRWAE